MPPKKTIDKPLTEVELELMNIIWSLGECTVKEVQLGLPKDRDLAYTSVATVIKILEQKGALKSTKSERAHTYQPLISKAEYESSSLRHLADGLFQGDPSSMVMRLISDSKLSKTELTAIQKILNERIKS